MKILLVRHGPAVSTGTDGVSEPDRPLSVEGRRKTVRAMKGLKRLKLGSGVVYTSPLPRAMQTAEILARELGRPRPRVADCLRPESPPDDVLEFLKHVKGVPALVGHEPGLSALLGFLLGTGPAESHPLKKAGVAVVSVKGAPARGRGTLHLLLTPSVLRSLWS
jgi:phosphohistidine phosphatase